MALAQLRRKSDNILIGNFFDADQHKEGWMGNRAIHHTIAGNTIPQKVAVMEYGFTFGLVFATDDLVNTPDRMDRFFLDVNMNRHFKYTDVDGDDWFVECISGWPENASPKMYADGTQEWTIVADFKLEGYIP